MQIKDLTIHHTKDLKTIIEHFTFSLNPGDKAVLIGEEGNGKSTILKAVYCAEEIPYAEVTGEIMKGNERIGYLKQELAEDEKRMTVYEYLCRTPSFYENTPRELALAENELGLDCGKLYSDQVMGTLSGGEKVKIQLAGIMLEQPDVLLLDEPSNDIDLETLDWLEHFINRTSRPILFVSHDETLIDHTANVIIHLEQIRKKTVPRYTVARLSYREYMEQRAVRFTHQEQVARKERSDYEKQQERFRQICSKVEHQQNAISRQDPHGGQLLKKKMKAVKSMEHRFEREHDQMAELPESETAIGLKFDESIYLPSGKTIVDMELDRLTAGGETLAKDIKLRVQGGEKVVITGKNGVGKTTLLKKIAEELLNRSDIQAAYMPQDYEEQLKSGLLPEEFLERTGDREERTRIRTYLGSMRYTRDEMEHPLEELSGGQKAKLLLMKMNLDKANVLILDEPTRNFSPLSNPVIRETLQNYKGTIISISHDRKYISEVCTTVYELTEDGLIRKWNDSFTGQKALEMINY